MGSSKSKLEHSTWYSEIRHNGATIYEEYLESNLPACIRDKNHKARLKKVLSTLNIDKKLALVNKRLEIKDFMAVYCYCTPLAYAISKNDLDLVKMLIHHGADASVKPCYLKKNCKKAKGQIDPVSHIHFACMSNCDIEIMRMLIEAGSSLEEIPRKDYHPVLQYAASCSDVKVLHQLMGPALIGGNTQERRDMILARDKNGESVLHHAVSNRNKLVTEILLENGFDMNIRDSRKRTPLMIAVESNHMKLVNILLESGAHIAVNDETGSSPLAYAFNNTGNLDYQQSNKKVLIIQKLRDHLPWPRLSAQTLADCAKFVLQYFPSYTILELLDANKGNLDGMDEDGRTFLYHAIDFDNSVVFQWLLRNGAAIDNLDEMFLSPLMHACKTGRMKFVEELVGNGADITAVTIEGWTPLWCALRHGWQDIATFLVRQGCDIDYNIRLDQLKTEHSHILLPASIVKSKADKMSPFEYAIHSNYFTIALLSVLSGCRLVPQTTEEDDMVAKSVHETVTEKYFVNCLKSDDVSKIINTSLYSIRTVMKRPRTLQEACRIQIRRSLQAPVYNSVEQLPLSDQLKAYVCLRDTKELLKL